MMVVGAVVQGPKEVGDVDTDDEKDEEAQYEQWKSRELARIRFAFSKIMPFCRPGISRLRMLCGLLGQSHCPPVPIPGSFRLLKQPATLHCGCSPSLVPSVSATGHCCAFVLERLCAAAIGSAHMGSVHTGGTGRSAIARLGSRRRRRRSRT